MPRRLEPSLPLTLEDPAPAAERAAAEPAIEAHGLSRSFDGRRAVDGVDLRLERGGFLAVLGPSGSGKTTLLRMIAGFERPDAGSVRIAGRAVAGPGAWVEPEARRIGMVFQQGALFPHLTVAGNVGFGATGPARVAECLELVGLAGPRARGYPHELSGGERQRVALARALAADPEVVLLDEPFSALDAGLRERLREEVAAILRAAGTSTLLVTHDQSEALSLADTVAVLREGRLEQVGTPEEVYERPRSHWVAGFLGDADVRARRRRATGFAECELGRFAVGPGAQRRGRARDPARVGRDRAPGRARRRRLGARRRALVLRARPARRARAAERPAPAQPQARLPGVASGRPRARLARRPGDRARRRSRAGRRHRAVDVAGARGEDQLAVGVGADVREQRHLGPLAAHVLGAARGRAAQRPQRAGAVVAVDVAPDQAGQPAAAVDERRR